MKSDVWDAYHAEKAVDSAITNLCKAYEAEGVRKERERMLRLKNEIINCVIDYGLMPAKYDKVVASLEALIRGEQK
jgi:hypothetical protein